MVDRSLTCLKKFHFIKKKVAETKWTEVWTGQGGGHSYISSAIKSYAQEDCLRAGGFWQPSEKDKG